MKYVSNINCSKPPFPVSPVVKKINHGEEGKWGKEKDMHSYKLRSLPYPRGKKLPFFTRLIQICF